MKKLFACLSLFALVYAQENLIVKETVVHTITSFDNFDYFTTFTRAGEFLWEIPFNSRIQSTYEEGEQIFILSQTRDKGAFFLSCIDKENGKVIWEKGIFAPTQISSIDDLKSE